MSAHQQNGRLLRAPSAATTIRALLVPLGSLGLLIVGGLVWQAASGLTFVIPSVPDTVDAFFDSLASEAFLRELHSTLGKIAVAFAIGVGLGAGVGVVLGYMPAVRRALEPTLMALYSMPKIILYPLLLPIFQAGATSQIVMGVLHAAFPMLIMVSGAVASIPRVYLRLARSLEASPAQVLWRITLPAIRKSLLTGMRLGVSLATIGVILAEFFLTQFGLGKVMNESYEFAQYPQLISTVAMLLAACFVVSFAIWTIERRLPE